ncbi:hypothetical protein C8D92_107186 [Tamilnaduibacter salinus]|uniref:Transporter n=1 Tax=Tamilnaduibacter salinus TaxID=1484056 RepID=A0A2U1CVD6_9GAMM|nr:hypothetical protein [Tamilnaduibacter salinus]PVY75463.1 hypothetical protein C8D92_107186 [Tamilnaduibacter salinus]
MMGRLALFLLGVAIMAPARAELSARVSGAEADRSAPYRETVSAVMVRPDEHRVWSLDHEYRVLELLPRNGVPPATNGHVHQLAVGWSDRVGAWDVSLAPTLAVSSNVLRHPASMRLDDWRLDGRVVRRTVGLAGGDWRWGIGVDDRFGDYAPWPLVQWQTTLGEAFELTLGLPSNGVEWRVTERWRLSLDVFPDGGQWQVRDESRTRVSRLEQTRWRADLALQWRVLPKVALAAGVARLMDRRWSYRLEDGRGAERTPSSANAWFLAISWRLPGQTDN